MLPHCSKRLEQHCITFMEKHSELVKNRGLGNCAEFCVKKRKNDKILPLATGIKCKSTCLACLFFNPALTTTSLTKPTNTAFVCFVEFVKRSFMVLNLNN